VHDSRKDKINDMKTSFYEELEQVFDKFPKYHKKILLADFNAKVARGKMFKPTIGNKILHEISNDNGDRTANFATSKNAYADYVNLLADNMNTINKITQTLTESSKYVGLRINVEKTKYILPSRHWIAGRNWHITIASR
jgi:uncharacterized phage infection (PIP) family protein YhgE